MQGDREVTDGISQAFLDSEQRETIVSSRIMELARRIVANVIDHHIYEIAHHPRDYSAAVQAYMNVTLGEEELLELIEALRQLKAKIWE